MQADVMDFAMDVYGSMALQYFSGSYSSLANYLSSKCCDPSDYRDNNIMDASSHFIDRVHEQLVSLDSSLLIDATKTGKYDTKASAFRVNNALHHYFEDIEHQRDEDGDCIYFPTNEDKDILFERVRALVDDVDSHGGGMPKKLGRKSKATESQYKCDFARFMLFFARSYLHFFDPRTNAAIGDCLKCFASDVYNSPGGSDRALGAIATFTLLSLHLPSEADYKSMVLKSHTLPAMYAMAKAIHVSRRENDSYVYRIESPATTHGATSSLLHTLRVGTVGCMLHAALTGDVSLQRQLPSIHHLCCSQAILELSSLARVCKNYESFLSRGIDPAQHRVEDGEDVFRIKQVSDKGSFLDFKRRHFQSALRNGCSEVEESMRFLLVSAFTGKYIDIEMDSKRTRFLLNAENMPILLSGLFQTSATFYQPGTHQQCQEKVQVLKRSRDGQRDSLNIFASTVSARFSLTLSGGNIAFVNSCDLSILLSQALIGDNALRCDHDEKVFQIRTIFGSLMQFSMRGTARPWEMLGWKPGMTNDSTISTFRPDVVVRSATAPIADRLACSFRRNKHGGSGLNDTGFMELPHGAGHLLGVFLSIFHSAGADFLFNVNRDIPGSPSLARLYLSSFFHTTEFSSATPKYGKWPANDSTFARCLERLFGLPIKSISLATFRQVMCSVSTRQQSLMEALDCKDGKNLVSETRARGFNHSSRTHDNSYNHAHQEGNQFIAFQRQGLSERMDEFHHNWIGDQALHPAIADSAPILDSWRCPRLVADDEALGFLLLCSSSGYQSRAPYQKLVLTEALSMCRDSLVVAPCGSGKTNAIVASVLYSKLCSILRRHNTDSEMLLWLQRKFDASSGIVSESDVSARILSHPSVQKFLRFCRADVRPPAPNKFTICVVPHASAVDELISHVNSMQLAKAVSFEPTDLHAFMESAQDAGDFPSNPFPFDVLVMTAAQAVQDKARCFLQKCLQEQLLYTLVVDESHCFVTEISYMRCLGIIANLPRHGTPLLALTGSLPHCLVKSLASVLQASFGICLSSWRHRCTVEHSHHGMDASRDDFLRHYTDNNGVWRPSITIPPNVAHCSLCIPDVSDTSTAHLLKKLINKLDALQSIHSLQACKVLVICGTTNMACEIKRILGDSSIMLLGKRSKGKGLPEESINVDQNKAFRDGWVEGRVRIGVGTTVLAQCINQAACDLVICVDLLFNLLTYLQASSRGGRAKQKSLSIFMYRSKTLEACCSREIDFVPYRMWGVDTECPLVRRALSTESLLPFVQPICSNAVCRRQGISHEIDSVPASDSDRSLPVELSIPTDWCCDVCSSGIARVRRKLLSVCNQHTSPTSIPTSITQSQQSWDDSTQSQAWDDSGVSFPLDAAAGSDTNSGLALLDVILPPDDTAPPTPLSTPLYSSNHTVDSSPAPSVRPIGNVTHTPSVQARGITVSPSSVVMPAGVHCVRPIGNVTHTPSVQARGITVSPSSVVTPAGIRCNETNRLFSPMPPNPYRKCPTGSVVPTFSPTVPSPVMTPPRHDCQSTQQQTNIRCRPTSIVPDGYKETHQHSAPLVLLSVTTSHNRPSVAHITYPDDSSACIVNGPVVTRPLMNSKAIVHASSCPLRAFVTVEDGRLRPCCPWHLSGVPPHENTPLEKNPLFDNLCRKAFIAFLGRSGLVCNKCGDNPFHCQKVPKTINTCRMQGLVFNADYCAFCGVHNQVGEAHNEQRCPGNRLWGLVIWAFRSKRGHQKMSDEWNRRTSARVVCAVAYPDIVPFGVHTSNRVASWHRCLRFLVQNEITNRHFWQCMLNVLQHPDVSRRQI
jgi:hypothetical protein